MQEVENRYLAELDMHAASTMPDADPDTDWADLSGLYGSLSGLAGDKDESVESESDPIAEEAAPEECATGDVAADWKTPATAESQGEESVETGAALSAGADDQVDTLDSQFWNPPPAGERGAGNAEDAAHARDNPPPALEPIRSARLIAMEALHEEARAAVQRLAPRWPHEIARCTQPAFSKYAKDMFDKCAEERLAADGSINSPEEFAGWLRSECLAAVVEDVCGFYGQFPITLRFIADLIEADEEARETWRALWRILAEEMFPDSPKDKLKARLAKELDNRSLYWEGRMHDKTAENTIHNEKGVAVPQDGADDVGSPTVPAPRKKPRPPSDIGRSSSTPPSVLSVSMNELPVPQHFSADSRRAVSLATIRADRTFADAEANGTELVEQCIASIFTVFATEARKYGDVPEIKSFVKEFVNELFHEVERTKCGNRGVLVVSGQIKLEARAAFERSPAWRQFEDDLLGHSPLEANGVGAASSISEPKAPRPRGPKPDYERASAVRGIVERIAGGESWKSRLDEICAELDEAKIARPKTWKGRGHTDWTDCLVSEPKLVSLAVEHALDLAAEQDKTFF
jgi:hypothetical protein